MLPALLTVRRDGTGLGRRSVRRKTKAARENAEPEHMERITYQQCALQASYFQHSRDCTHRLAGSAPLTLNQNRGIGNSVLSGIGSSDCGFARRIAGASPASEDQQRG